MSKDRVKTVVIGCMWCGLREEADGTVRVPCSGRVDAGAILGAFRDGVSGVLVLGCAECDCHYKTGSRLAAETVASVRELLRAYGIEPERLTFREVRRRADEAAQAMVDFENSITELGPLRTARDARRNE